MDTQTIDQEFAKLQTEFQDVAGTVKALADKLKAAAASGDANATEWLGDLQLVAKDIDDEQDQAHALLLAIHGYITDELAKAPQTAGASDHPPLFAPGQEPDDAQQQQAQPQRRGLFGGMFGGGMGGGMMGGGMMGGGMMGGGMMGGYGGGGFTRAMEFGAGMSLGADLVGSIFR
jgi:hypothetical protein